MRCAIYCRLSKEDDEKIRESESIQNQRAMLQQYAADQNWEIYGVYADEDFSGADRNRPQFNAMLCDAKDNKFDIILCKTQSRFTRDMEMVEKYLHGSFPQWGIRFVAVLDHIDTHVKGNKKARQISGLINEWYLEDLSENIRAVLDQKRKAGQYIGSFATYGYQKDPSNRNRLLVDEQAAQVVRQIYALYLHGLGTQRIANRLNESGILSPAAYKQAQGLLYASGSSPKKTGKWSSTAVSRILRNEMYCGTMVQGVKQKVSYKSDKVKNVPRTEWLRVPGTHTPIIDQASFQAVQKRLQANTRSDGKGNVHVLSGKVYCADCGSTMLKVSSTYKGRTRSYLQCSLYASTRKKPACTRHSIRLDTLTKVVEQCLSTKIQDAYKWGDLSRFQVCQIRPSTNYAQREQARLLRRIDRLDRTLRDLYMDKVDGIVATEQYVQMQKSFLAERQQLQKRVEKLEKKQTPPTKTKEETLSRRIQKLLTPPFIGRVLYDLVLDRVAIGEKDTQTRTQTIQIYWKL